MAASASPSSSAATPVDAARLRRDADIAVVWNEGVRSRNALFAMRALPNRRREVRIAVSTSRSLGTAVVRNRTRRRMRAAFRAAISSLDLSSGLDLVAVAQPGLIRASFRDLVAAAANALVSVARRTASPV
ncbi:MAG TPA: ribonuclease P protein component [Candidatus Limnocylindria bacterium]